MGLSLIPRWSLKVRLSAVQDELQVTMNNSKEAQSEQPSPRTIKFRIGKEHLRKFEFPNGEDITIYHLYPTLAEWVGKAIPDEVNPRSHDMDMIQSSVARDIKGTIRNRPEDFFLANRGATVIAEALHFDPTRGAGSTNLIQIPPITNVIHIAGSTNIIQSSTNSGTKRRWMIGIGAERDQ